MTVDINDLASLLLALFGLIGLLAGAAAYFRVSYVKNTIDLLKEHNAAQETRIKTLENSETEKAAKIEALESQVATFSDENRRLTMLLQGRADLSILGDRLSTLETAITRHHEEVMEDRREFFHAWKTSLTKQEQFFDRLARRYGGEGHTADAH